MIKVRFLVPGTTAQFRCGGLLAELQAASVVGQIADVQVVTYRQREADKLFLEDSLRCEPAPGPALWIVSWGFDVPRLLHRLYGRPVAYHAHSSGYGFDLPPAVPVLAVSRNTLGYWGNRAPRNPLFLVPNALDPQWLQRGARPRGTSAESSGQQARPIDVLVQRRKTSAYVLEQLVPALRARGFRVEVQSGWVEDLVELFNSASVYLYDSSDYWRARGVSEGFGLPPIEAMAAGCVVFSSLNHALADLLEPGVLGHQIGCGTLEADLERITAAVMEPPAWRADPSALASVLDSVAEQRVSHAWSNALTRMEELWSRVLRVDAPPPLRPSPAWRLRMNIRLQGIKARFNRLAGWPPPS